MCTLKCVANAKLDTMMCLCEWLLSSFLYVNNYLLVQCFLAIKLHRPENIKENFFRTYTHTNFYATVFFVTSISTSLHSISIYALFFILIQVVERGRFLFLLVCMAFNHVVRKLCTYKNPDREKGTERETEGQRNRKRKRNDEWISWGKRISSNKSR